MSPSRILRTENVAFDNSIMKLNEKDQRLRVQIHKALDAHREIFIKKKERYEAVERNFGILRRISRQQKEEFKQTLLHTKEADKKLNLVTSELENLAKTHNILQEEFKELKKKEAFFEKEVDKKINNNDDVTIFKKEIDHYKKLSN